MKENETEKLVKEIAFLISEKAEYDIETDLYDGLPMGTTMINSHEIARRAIALIGKAYAEGMPLPEEVGRDEVEAFFVDDYLDDNLKVIGELLPMLEKGDILIALRKQEKE